VSYFTLDGLACGNFAEESPRSTKQCPLWVIADMCAAKVMFALPPKADMCGATRDVRFGPRTNIWQCNRRVRFLMANIPQRGVSQVTLA